MINHRSFLRDLSHFSRAQRQLPKTRRQERIESMSFEQQMDMAKNESLKYTNNNNYHNIYHDNNEFYQRPAAYNTYQNRRSPNNLCECGEYCQSYFPPVSDPFQQCSDYSYNNDEDLRKAIEESLLEKRKMEEKELQAFQRDEYNTHLEEAIEESLREKHKMEEKILQTDQNHEYNTLLKQTIESQNKEFLEKKKREQLKEQEEKRKNEEKQNLQQQIEKIKEAAENLPPEPQNGISIAVVLPNQKRIMRKFNPEELAQDVYTWVAADDTLIKDETYSTDFELVCPFSPALDKTQSLVAQGFKGRVLFTVQTKV